MGTHDAEAPHGMYLACIIVVVHKMNVVKDNLAHNPLSAPYIIYFRDLYGYPSVHGAVFSNRKSDGPVRCGFRKSEILR